jgi:hypothetical protein
LWCGLQILTPMGEKERPSWETTTGQIRAHHTLLPPASTCY